MAVQMMDSDDADATLAVQIKVFVNPALVRWLWHCAPTMHAPGVAAACGIWDYSTLLCARHTTGHAHVCANML